MKNNKILRITFGEGPPSKYVLITFEKNVDQTKFTEKKLINKIKEFGKLMKPKSKISVLPPVKRNN